MPRRPREHELESESRRAFEAAIAPWLFRSQPYDYGIDGEVEVVEDDGELRGILFKVQLKGTTLDFPEALTIRVKVDTYHYWMSLPLPVLVALYHRPTAEIFVRWVHTFEVQIGKTQQTVALQLHQKDSFTPESPEQLVHDIEHYEVLQDRHFRFPVPTGVDPVNWRELGTSAPEVRLAIRNTAAAVSDVIHIPEGGKRGLINVQVASDRILIHVSGRPLVTIDELEYTGDDLLLCAVDVLVSVALALSWVGEATAAARLFLILLPKSSFLGTREFVLSAARAFVSAHRTSDLVRLAAQLASRQGPDDWTAVESLSPMVLLGFDTLSESERGQWEQVLRSRVQEAQVCGLSSAEATAKYNLGNFLRSAHQYDRAIAEYEQAAIQNPDYDSRPYFHHEVAGCHFLRGRFTKAAEHYRRALDLGASGMTRALHADAVMFCGRYEEAMGILSDEQERVGVLDAEFALKLVALSWLVNEYGIKYQDREAARAQSLAEVPTPPPSPRQVADQMGEAIALDALCGQAWFRYAMAHGRLGADPTDLQGPHILAAIILLTAPRPWAYALLSVLLDPEAAPLAGAVVETAHHWCGQDFVDEFTAITPDASEAQRGPVLELIDAVAATKPQRTPVEVRFFEEHGEYSVFTID